MKRLDEIPKVIEEATILVADYYSIDWRKMFKRRTVDDVKIAKRVLIRLLFEHIGKEATCDLLPFSRERMMSYQYENKQNSERILSEKLTKLIEK